MTGPGPHPFADDPNPNPQRFPLIGFRQHVFNSWDRNPFPIFRDIDWWHITLSLEVKEGCEWVYDERECNSYLRIPVDQCQRDDVNYKKGGTCVGRTGYKDFYQRQIWGDNGMGHKYLTSMLESGYDGDEELQRMAERGEGEDYLGQKIEGRGMSRQCLVWRIDPNDGLSEAFHGGELEPWDVPTVEEEKRKEEIERKRVEEEEERKKDMVWWPVTQADGGVVYVQAQLGSTVYR